MIVIYLSEKVHVFSSMISDLKYAYEKDEWDQI